MARMRYKVYSALEKSKVQENIQILEDTIHDLRRIKASRGPIPTEDFKM